MYNIYYYKNVKGQSEIADYFHKLSESNSKDSRIKLSKIRDQLKALSEYGTRAGEPHMKHLDGEIWKLRPLQDRILFAAWHNDGFVLLHMFVKKTQKTPLREIIKAKNNLLDFKKRGHSND